MNSICLLSTALTVLMTALPSTPLLAGDGEIIITREVQPRIATRQAMVPDPNPKSVYGSPDAYLNNGILGTKGNELSDADFASINSGMAVTQRLLTGQSGALQPSSLNSQHVTSTTSWVGGQAGGGASGGVGGMVNQSVQQGLRPMMQALGQ